MLLCFHLNRQSHGPHHPKPGGSTNTEPHPTGWTPRPSVHAYLIHDSFNVAPTLHGHHIFNATPIPRPSSKRVCNTSEQKYRGDVRNGGRSEQGCVGHVQSESVAMAAGTSYWTC
ncbi:hypothetical protein SLA2020_281110 [Shorea laevis]